MMVIISALVENQVVTASELCALSQTFKKDILVGKDKSDWLPRIKAGHLKADKLPG